MVDFELSIWLEEVRSLLETLEVSSPSKRERKCAIDNIILHTTYMLSTNILCTIQADIPLSLQGLKGYNILDKLSEIRTETFEQQH